MAEKPENLLLADYGQLKWEYEKAYAEIDSLKCYLDDTIDDLNQTQKRMLVEREWDLKQAERFAEYSRKVQALTAGIKTWLAAIQDTWGNEDTSRPALAVLVNWIIIMERQTPEMRVNDSGRAFEYDDIPF